MPDDWLTVAQAAQLLGVTKRQIQRLITAGALDHRKEGRRYLVARSDLESRRESHPAQPAAEMVPADVAALIERQAARLEVYAARMAAAETERDLLRDRVAMLEREIAWLRLPWLRRLLSRSRPESHLSHRSEDG